MIGIPLDRRLEHLGDLLRFQYYACSRVSWQALKCRPNRAAGNGTVRVLLDRRVIARRARSEPYEAERRQADRRLPSKIDALLRAIGWAIVPLAGPKNYHRGSAL